MPASFPVAALRLSGPPDLVLAEGLHGIELTVAEYNARAGRAMLPADMDTLQARREYLDRVIFQKVVAAEGRLRGFTAPSAGNSLEEERAIARQVIRESVREAQQIGDEEARRFFDSHRDRFPDLEPSSLDNPGYMMHVKFTLHDQQWRAQVQKWTEREKVVVHRDRFEELARESTSSRAAHSSQTSEPKENES
jgi:hypothetical protein